MSTSTLDTDNDFQSDRQLGVGHGSNALGPSDTSDSGSDMTGSGENLDDSNTDSTGTGERASVRITDDGSAARDISADHIVDSLDDEDMAEDGATTDNL